MPTAQILTDRHFQITLTTTDSEIPCKIDSDEDFDRILTMPIPHICLWRYFPIDHANRVVKLEPYRTKKECQALGDPWDGIHGAVLREILIEDETAYKLLPSERVDPRGGFKGGVRPQSPTRQISISDGAIQELKRRLENGEGQCMSEILSKLILATPLDLQITPKRSRYGHSTRVSVDARTHLMKILNRYKLRGNKSGFTVLAIVDEILEQNKP